MLKIITPLFTICISFSLFLQLPTYANDKIVEDFSGSVTLTSDYICYGVSQTDHSPAIQGELYYNILGSDFYVGIFGSNVDYGEEYPYPHTEFDFEAGYEHDFNKDWGVGFSVVSYRYPKASEANFEEVLGKLRYKVITTKFGYTNNIFNTGTTAYHIDIGSRHDLFSNTQNKLLKNLSLGGFFGYFRLNQDIEYGSYCYYQVSLIKTIMGVKFEAGWTDTIDGKFDDDAGDGRFLFTISKDF